MTWYQILIICLAFVIFLYLAFAIIIVFLANSKLFLVRGKDPDNDCYLKFEDFTTLNREEYSCFYKGETIRGYIYTYKEYKDEYKGFIILSHGLWGSHIQYLLDIELLASLGYKVLAYDNYGVGISDGKTQVSLANSIYVLDAVISDIKMNQLNENLDIILYGHSMGGYAISCNLKKHKEIKKAIIRSAPLSASISGRDLLVMNNKFIGYFLYPIIPFATLLLLGKKNDLNSKSMLKKNKTTKVLLSQAKNDQIVPYKHSLAYKMLKSRQDNLEIYISEKGLHNSLVSEESQHNYSKLKKEYKKLLEENDQSKIDEFMLELHQNKRNYYQLDKELSLKIEKFLNE